MRMSRVFWRSSGWKRREVIVENEAFRVEMEFWEKVTNFDWNLEIKRYPYFVGNSEVSNEIWQRIAKCEKRRDFEKNSEKCQKKNAYREWYQSSQTMHWIISSSTVSSGSGYGRWHVQYSPEKFWLYVLSSLSSNLFESSLHRMANIFDVPQSHRNARFVYSSMRSWPSWHLYEQAKQMPVRWLASVFDSGTHVKHA